MSDNTESSQESSEQKQVTEITFIQTLSPEMIEKLRKRKQQDSSQKKTLDNLSSSAASRLLSAKIVFDKFEPKLITDKTIPCKDLDTKIKGSDYLFFDFSRGTTQECDVMYSLVKHYGIKDLAITTVTAFEVLIKFCKGESLTNDDIEYLEDLKLANSWFTIRDGIKTKAISVEMIKTISLLLDERIISNIHRVNQPQIDFSKKIHSDIIVIDGCGFLTPYAGSINKAMADQVLEIKSSRPILVFVPEIFRGRCYEGEPTGDFWHNLVPCSISHYIEEGAKKTFGINIKYESGGGYNNGRIPFSWPHPAGGGMSFPDGTDGYKDEYRFFFAISNTIVLCY